MLQASSGIQPLLPAYVHSQEVATLPRGKCYLQEDTSSLKPYLPQSKKSEDEH